MNIVKPHRVISRLVENKDLPRVLSDAKEIIELCRKPLGKYPSAKAIAHAQVVDDPLCFFVLIDGTIVINPSIVRHTKTYIQRREGCMSFAERAPIMVNRWNKCTVRYYDEHFKLFERNLSGIEAEVFQHEIDHMHAVYIYDYVDN